MLWLDNVYVRKFFLYSSLFCFYMNKWRRGVENMRSTCVCLCKPCICFYARTDWNFRLSWISMVKTLTLTMRNKQQSLKHPSENRYKTDLQNGNSLLGNAWDLLSSMRFFPPCKDVRKRRTGLQGPTQRQHSATSGILWRVVSSPWEGIDQSVSSATRIRFDVRLGDTAHVM